MDTKFDKMLKENSNLDEGMVSQIQEAWNEKLDESRKEIAAELREEFSRKYTHDKALLAESMDKFLNDRLREEMVEFAQDKKALVEERVSYKRNLKEHTKVLDKFITERLVEQANSAIADKKQVKENFKRLEGFLLKQLTNEIREFHADKRNLVEQKVKVVAEGKRALMETRKAFINKAAKVIEGNINHIIAKEIKQFREDIEASRRNDFGKRIFESFVAEYMGSFLNENSEINKLQTQLEKKDKKLNEWAEKFGQYNQLTENLQVKYNAAKDMVKRERDMNELLQPLMGEKKAVMAELLESVQTKDLTKAYNKYLPTVLNETVKPERQKKIVNSGIQQEKTGNKNTKLLEDNDFQVELEQMKSLAGIK